MAANPFQPLNQIMRGNTCSDTDEERSQYVGQTHETPLLSGSPIEVVTFYSIMKIGKEVVGG